MPLQRRLPKRGFTNIFRKEYEIVDISRLGKISSDLPITPEIMKEHGLIKKPERVKVLANGDLSVAVTVHAQKFSKSAKEKIEKSGGKAIII
ncbi:MAG: hypothetical protein NPINA01_20490 [Nitrospinaceae bacterium]|nr:MAG: hypothetical protein NPINA01_20490 [Nitrospinaceae bacterium]